MTEAISLIAGLMMGLPTLFYAIQLLYINLVTDGFPALSLAFSPKNPKIMKESPEKEMSLLTPFDTEFIVAVGLMGSVLVLGSYFLLGKAAAFSVLVLIQSFILVDLWLSHQAIRNNFQKLVRPIFLTAFIFPFIIQYVIVSFPYTADLFRITPLTISQYVQAAVISSLILVGIKAVKVFLRP
jgi:Ca2+-transporting ATPase